MNQPVIKPGMVIGESPKVEIEAITSEGVRVLIAEKVRETWSMKEVEVKMGFREI